MLFMTTDEKYMKIAIKQAKKALSIGEVPIGAVIVEDNKIIAYGYNKRETKQNALLHAELVAIDKACKKLGSWRLSDCTLYVTLEPCAMCGGAIINSRIGRVVYGAFDKRFGALGSVCNLLEMPFNHKAEITSGVMQEECLSIIQDFFAQLRKQKSKKRKKS